MANYDKVTPGTKASKGPLFRTGYVNDSIDVIKAFKAIELGKAQRPPQRPFLDTNAIRIRNATGQNLVRGNIVQIGTLLIDGPVRSTIAHDGLLYATDGAPLAIIQEAIAASDVGLYSALVDGAALALVDIDDFGHFFARPVPGQLHLQSTSDGPLEIISPILTFGLQEALVRFGRGMSVGLSHAVFTRSIAPDGFGTARPLIVDGTTGQHIADLESEQVNVYDLLRTTRAYIDHRLWMTPSEDIFPRSFGLTNPHSFLSSDPLFAQFIGLLSFDLTLPNQTDDPLLIGPRVGTLITVTEFEDPFEYANGQHMVTAIVVTETQFPEITEYTSDSFARANGPLGQTDGNHPDAPGLSPHAWTASGLEIVGGRAKHTSGSPATATIDTDEIFTGNDFAYVFADLPSTTSRKVGVIFDSNGTNYYAAVLDTTHATLAPFIAIYRLYGGTYQCVAMRHVTAGSTGRIGGVRISDDVVRCVYFEDGATTPQWVDSIFDEVDNDIATFRTYGTEHGVYGQRYGLISWTTGAEFSGFVVAPGESAPSFNTTLSGITVTNNSYRYAPTGVRISPLNLGVDSNAEVSFPMAWVSGNLGTSDQFPAGLTQDQRNRNDFNEFAAIDCYEMRQIYADLELIRARLLIPSGEYGLGAGHSWRGTRRIGYHELLGSPTNIPVSVMAIDHRQAVAFNSGGALSGSVSAVAEHETDLNTLAIWQNYYGNGGEIGETHFCYVTMGAGHGLVKGDTVELKNMTVAAYNGTWAVMATTTGELSEGTMPANAVLLDMFFSGAATGDWEQIEHVESMLSASAQPAAGWIQSFAEFWLMKDGYANASFMTWWARKHCRRILAMAFALDAELNAFDGITSPLLSATAPTMANQILLATNVKTIFQTLGYRAATGTARFPFLFSEYTGGLQEDDVDGVGAFSTPNAFVTALAAGGGMDALTADQISAHRWRFANSEGLDMLRWAEICCQGGVGYNWEGQPAAPSLTADVSIVPTSSNSAGGHSQRAVPITSMIFQANSYNGGTRDSLRVTCAVPHMVAQNTLLSSDGHGWSQISFIKSGPTILSGNLWAKVISETVIDVIEETSGILDGATPTDWTALYVRYSYFGFYLGCALCVASDGLGNPAPGAGTVMPGSSGRFEPRLPTFMATEVSATEPNAWAKAVHDLVGFRIGPYQYHMGDIVSTANQAGFCKFESPNHQVQLGEYYRVVAGAHDQIHQVLAINDQHHFTTDEPFVSLSNGYFTGDTDNTNYGDSDITFVSLKNGAAFAHHLHGRNRYWHAIAMSGADLITADSFNRPDTDDIGCTDGRGITELSGAGKLWVTTGGDMAIMGMHLEADDNSESISLLSAVGANIWVQFRVPVNAGQIGVVINASDASNYWMLRYIPATAPRLAIVKVVAGVKTVTASITAAEFATGFWLAIFRESATVLHGYVSDGVDTYDVMDPAATFNATATGAGVWRNGGALHEEIDDFQVFASDHSDDFTAPTGWVLPVYADSFNRGDSDAPGTMDGVGYDEAEATVTATGTQPAWTETSVDMDIATNELVGTAATARVTAEMGVALGWAQVTLTGTIGGQRVAGNFVDVNNTWYAEHSGTNLNLIEVTGGSPLTRATITSVGANAGILALWREDSLTIHAIFYNATTQLVHQATYDAASAHNTETTWGIAIATSGRTVDKFQFFSGKPRYTWAEILAWTQPRYADRFNRGDSDTLGNQSGIAVMETGGGVNAFFTVATWAELSGDLDIATNQVVGTTAGIMRFTTTSAFGWAEILLTGTIGGQRVAGNITDANNYWYAGHDGTDLVLVEVTGGTPTTRATVDDVGANGGILALWRESSTIIHAVFHNNTSGITYQGSYTSATAHNTVASWGVEIATNGRTFDNFAMYDAKPNYTWADDDVTGPWTRPLFADSFNRANNVTVGVQDGDAFAEDGTAVEATGSPQTWTEASGDLDIVSNQLVATAAGRLTFPAGVATGWMQIKLTGTIGGQRVIGNYQDANNTWIAEHTGSNLNLIVVIGGTPTTVGTVASVGAQSGYLILYRESSSIIHAIFYNITTGVMHRVSEEGATQHNSQTTWGVHINTTGRTCDEAAFYADAADYSWFTPYVPGGPAWLAPVYADSFNRVNDADLGQMDGDAFDEDGDPVSASAGTQPTWSDFTGDGQINSNQLLGVAAGQYIFFADASLGWAQAKLTGTIGGQRILGNFLNSNNKWIAEHSGANLNLYEVNGGTVTLRATVSSIGANSGFLCLYRESASIIHAVFRNLTTGITHKATYSSATSNNTQEYWGVQISTTNRTCDEFQFFNDVPSYSWAQAAFP